jgi:effector-binding domain-containing protein
MKKTFLQPCLCAYLLLLTLFTACSNGSEQPATGTTASDSTPAKKKQATATAPPVSQERPPIINVMDSIGVKRTVIYIKDSAATFERISLKLGEIYGFKLATVIKKSGVKVTGQPMAWYKNPVGKAPYFFEAGIPVDKKPSRLPSNILVKQMGADSVTVAHFYGPYHLLPQAYEAVSDILKERKKKLKDKPYEVYIDDPMDKDGKLKDPYKVQTDIVFPWK